MIIVFSLMFNSHDTSLCLIFDEAFGRSLIVLLRIFTALRFKSAKQTIACSKAMIETLKEGVRYVQS